MKPIIVISASYNLKNSEKKYFLHDSYVKAIRAAGGIPLLIPITADVEVIFSLVCLLLPYFCPPVVPQWGFGGQNYVPNIFWTHTT